jgi:hypothetical protein
MNESIKGLDSYKPVRKKDIKGYPYPKFITTWFDSPTSGNQLF